MSFFKVIKQLMIGSQKTRGARKIVSQGNHYDLQAIFAQINDRYFNNQLSLPITWSGNAQQSVRYRRRLGSYNLRTGQIKIHRLLDNPSFPPYFISFVVYHEMLHHLYPPMKGARGRRVVHHKEFKKKEREFEDYFLAREWEKENLKLILGAYGRT